MKKPKEDDIINAVWNIWYDEWNFPKEDIAKFFKIRGISSELDGSEDNQIIHQHEFWDEIIRPSEININDNEFKEMIKKVEIERKNKKIILALIISNQKFLIIWIKNLEPMIRDD